MENNRYNNSKIYKLVDQVNGYFYIGSTCNPLSKRLYWHKYDARKHPEQKVYKYFNEIGFDNVKIILIEEHYLDNREQLIREEDKVIQMYIDDEKCLNSIRAFTGLSKQDYDKKYTEDNQELIKQKYKIYYEKNKDEIRRKKCILSKEYYQNHKEERQQYKKDFYQENKEKVKEYKRIYNERNKEKIQERNRIIITCQCGSEIRKNEQSRHFKSKKHQAFIHDRQQTAETI